VPIINLEWIQKLHQDKGTRGYSREAVINTIPGRMPDYVEWGKWIQWCKWIQ
jgi:phosphoribulokinase